MCRICAENPDAPEIKYVTAKGLAFHMEFVHGIKPIETNGQRTVRDGQEIIETRKFSLDDGARVVHSLSKS